MMACLCAKCKIKSLGQKHLYEGLGHEIIAGLRTVRVSCLETLSR